MRRCERNSIHFILIILQRGRASLARISDHCQRFFFSFSLPSFNPTLHWWCCRCGTKNVFQWRQQQQQHCRLIRLGWSSVWPQLKKASAHHRWMEKNYSGLFSSTSSSQASLGSVSKRSHSLSVCAWWDDWLQSIRKVLSKEEKLLFGGECDPTQWFSPLLFSSSSSLAEKDSLLKSGVKQRAIYSTVYLCSRLLFTWVLAWFLALVRS